MTKSAIDNSTSNATANDFAELKKKSLTGIGSLVGRQFLVYGILFVGNIVLARILLPQTFGIYAIVTFVVQFFSTFSDVGIGAVLIQKKEELTKEELSTLFWLQQMLALTVVVAAYITAPLALRIYPSLPPVTVWLIRGMAITFLFSSFKTVPAILMERVLDFRRIAVVDIAETVVFQAAAIAFALMGFDVWSFIIAALLRGLLGAGLIYMMSPWRPSFRYRLASVHGLIRFGLPYQGNTILSFIKDAVTPLFVGIYAGVSAVGYVNWARNLAFAPLLLSQSFGRVAFPAFARLQHERILLKETIERSIRMMTFVMFPITVLLVALGPEITHVVFTDKWLPGINAFYIFCSAPFLMGITLPMVSAILSLGNARLLLLMTFVLIGIEWGLGVPFILAFGFTGIALTQPISYIIFIFIYQNILRKSGIDVAFFKNISRTFLSSLLTGLTVFIIKKYIAFDLITLVLFLAGGCLLFLVFMYILNKQELNEFKKYISFMLADHIKRTYELGNYISNKIMLTFDPELRAISGIIRNTTKDPSYNNQLAAPYDQVFLDRKRTNLKALKMKFWEKHFELGSLEAYPEMSGRILDFGCGSGHLDILLARQGRIVHGIDMSPVGINIAYYLRSKESKHVQNRASFDLADVTNEPPKVELFDSAWSAHVFEHIEKPGPIFFGLKKWLKPGAYILISVPLGLAYDDPGHVNHFFNEIDIKAYLDGHVDVVKVDISEQHQVIRVLCKLS